MTRKSSRTFFRILSVLAVFLGGFLLAKTIGGGGQIEGGGMSAFGIAIWWAFGVFLSLIGWSHLRSKVRKYGEEIPYRDPGTHALE